VANPRKPAAARRRQGGTKKQNAVSHRPQPAGEEAALVELAGRDVPVSPPDDLPAPARSLWVELVRVLAQAGVVDKVDLPALRLFCVQYARSWQAKQVLDEPTDPEEDAALEQRLRETAMILNAQKVLVANALRAGVDVSPSKLTAIASLETTLSNLEAYRDARKRVGNLVALGSTGQLTEHPLLQTERMASSLALRFANRFGLTPADRASLGLALVEGSTRAAELDDVLGRSLREKRREK
jgi:phage terminase small subunit